MPEVSPFILTPILSNANNNAPHRFMVRLFPQNQKAPLRGAASHAPKGRLILTGGERSVTHGRKSSDFFFYFLRADSRSRGDGGGSVLTHVTDEGNEGDKEDAEENKKKPATFYSPTQSPMQYHRRKRA